MGPETEEQIKLERKTKFTLSCSFHKAIRTLTFRRREKIRQFILFQNFWYSLIASSIKAVILYRGLGIYSLNRMRYIAWTHRLYTGTLNNNMA